MIPHMRCVNLKGCQIENIRTRQQSSRYSIDSHIYTVFMIKGALMHTFHSKRPPLTLFIGFALLFAILSSVLPNRTALAMPASPSVYAEAGSMMPAGIEVPL